MSPAEVGVFDDRIVAAGAPEIDPDGSVYRVTRKRSSPPDGVRFDCATNRSVPSVLTTTPCVSPRHSLKESVCASVPGTPDAQVAYATLALGSAMALFLYPHAITAVLSSRSQDVVRRNMSLLPAWTFLLGLMALLGFMAIAAGVKVSNGQLAIPQLFENMFPDWFAGVAFAAIGIGALVPAAIMSIAAANLFTRNIYKDFIKPDATPAQETKVSKLVSLLVKVGALAFVLTRGEELEEPICTVLTGENIAREDHRRLLSETGEG